MRRILAVAVFLAVPGVAAATLDPSPHTAICFIDLPGPDAYYLQVTGCGAGAVGNGDSRLTSNGALPGGTLVRGADHDFSRSSQAPAAAAAYAFADRNGDRRYDRGDDVYVHFGPLPDMIRIGDVPVVGRDPFLAVAAGDDRLGFPLAAAAVAVGGESFDDADGSGGFSPGDRLFLDMDGNALTSQNDVLVAAGPALAAASSSSTSAPASTPSTTISSEAPTASASASIPSASSPAPPPNQGIPAGWLAFPALAVALLRKRPPGQV